MRISDWSSDVCSSDLDARAEHAVPLFRAPQDALPAARARAGGVSGRIGYVRRAVRTADPDPDRQVRSDPGAALRQGFLEPRRQFRCPVRGRLHTTARPRPLHDTKRIVLSKNVSVTVYVGGPC